MSAFPALESRHLKRSGLGTPDHYPQEDGQLEDSMSENNVREGFQYSKPVSDEYGTLKDSGNLPNASSVWAFLNSVLSEKRRCNTCPESNRKKQFLNLKDNFIVPINKHKEAKDNWFKKLAGSSPLSSLAVRVPLIKEKDDIFMDLYRNDVPVSRAIWFIKMSAMHATVMAENMKKKQKSTIDPATEWAYSICRLLNDILNRINEGEDLAVGAAEMSGTGGGASQIFDLMHKKWDYLFHIMLAMYDENLLDHWEILLWFVESLKKLTDMDSRHKHSDLDSTLKFFLPYVVQMGPRFGKSEITTRRLLFWVCNCFAEIIHDDPQVQPYLDSPAAFQSLMENYLELNSCPVHRTIVLSLSALIMGLTLQCPTAVVWNDVRDEESDLHGSPLDVLPCSLATLPSPPGPESLNLRNCLKFMEENIRERGLMAENRWYRKPNNTVDENTNNLLNVLDTLDRHDYNVVSESNNLEQLYSRIFEIERNPVKDAQLIMFLCEWVVSATRTGSHRPIIIACLFESLKKDYCPKEVFQDTLVKFLDLKAPQLDVNTSVDSEPFKNLVCLFGELIDREIFSHDHYVRILIARGILDTGTLPLPLPSLNTQQLSVKSDFSEDFDKISVENPDSVRSECSGLASGHSNPMLVDYKRHNRHIQYLLNFPLPQDESYTHEHNQRAQILYGVSRVRDGARHILKRLVRDISKLFTKKAYLIDVVQGEMGKRKKKDQQRDDIDTLHEDITRRFKILSYYDMEYVISQSILIFLDSLYPMSIQGKSSGASDRTHIYLPLPSTVILLFDLMEISLNITCLLQTVTDTISKLQQLSDNPVIKSRSRYMTMYTPVLCLHVVGILRKYQSVLMTMTDVETMGFKQLIILVRQVGNPSQCSSTDRCILAYLHDLFQSSRTVQNNFSRLYGKASTKVSSALFSPVEPARGRGTLNEKFAEELIQGTVTDICKFSEEIQNNPDSRYSFVCNVLVFITQGQSLDRLSIVCVLSAEMTAQCSLLPAEWLGALYTALSPKPQPGYQDLTKKINLDDPNIYDCLALLCGTLLSRQCFTVTDFVQHVICPAMAQGLDHQSSASVEPNIRLACHILYRLFTGEQSSGSGRAALVGAMTSFKFSEPLLLTGALQKISTEYLVDILKMLIVHGDKANASVQKKDHLETLYEKMSSGSEEKTETINVKSMKLGEFTQRVLREICNVAWVRERFSKETASRLIRDNVLIDKIFTPGQARNLLNIICRPSEPPSRDINTSMAMKRLLGKLDIWTLRFNDMELQLLLAQIPNGQQSELVTMAKAIVDMFQLQADSRVSASSEPGIPEVHLPDDDFSWLVPPLISRLPESLKAQIIKAASEKLESGKNFWSHKNDQEKERDLQRSSVVLAHPPFVTMLLGCLEKVEHKDDLLQSLNTQVLYFVQNAKETEDKVPDDLRIRQILQECLQVRLGLVGNLFPRIQENVDQCTDWCVLLAQLISFSVVELQTNRELFHTVLDMLATLIHTLIARNVNDRKHHSNVSKKIRKEIADKMSEGVDHIRQLLPIVKATYDVIAVTPLETGGNRGGGGGGSSRGGQDSSRNRKQGYIIQKKERINPWEMIESVKYLFSLSWYGAVRVEFPMSRVEQQAHLLLSHEHPTKLPKLDSYYLDAPQLPVEELEPDVDQAEADNPGQQQLLPALPPPAGLEKKLEPVVVTSIEQQPKVEAVQRSNSSTSSGGGTKRKRNRRNQNRNTNSPACVPPALRHPAVAMPPYPQAPRAQDIFAGLQTMQPQPQQQPQQAQQGGTATGWHQANNYAMPPTAAQVPPQGAVQRDVISSLRNRLPYPQTQTMQPQPQPQTPQVSMIRQHINKRIITPNAPRMHLEMNNQSAGPGQMVGGGMFSAPQQPPHHTAMAPPNPPPYPAAAAASAGPQPMDEGLAAGGPYGAPPSAYSVQRTYAASGGAGGGGVPQDTRGNFVSQAPDTGISYGMPQGGTNSNSYMMQRQPPPGHHQPQHHPGATPQYHTYQY